MPILRLMQISQVLGVRPAILRFSRAALFDNLEMVIVGLIQPKKQYCQH